MDYFIGLDAHKNSSTFVVLTPQGRVKRKAVVETSGRALIEFVKQIPGRRYLCTEESTQSQWLYEILSPHVHDLAIVLGRKSRGNKDDARDAHGLATRMRLGDLEQRIYKLPVSFTTLRELVRSYQMINKDLVRVKNRIHALYRSRGIPTQRDGCPFCAPQAPNGTGCRKPGFHGALERLRTQKQSLEALKEEAEKEMITEARRHAMMRILETAPGFGPVRSAQLLSIVITPHRFRTSRQFWSYCGLAIVQRSSDDWVQRPNGKWIRSPVLHNRGLNQNFNRTVKTIFKGAALTVTRSSHDPLRVHYDRLLANGTKPNLARLTLARKIAAIVLSMWKNQQAYEPGRENGVKNK
jgi:hypothetical protein